MKRTGLAMAMAVAAAAVLVAFAASGKNPAPRRVFPAWQPPSAAPASAPATDLLEEVETLLEQGRRDRAASPAFLDELAVIAAKERARRAMSQETPSDKLPLEPKFESTTWPAGWSAVDPTVWQFGSGEARQTRSAPNTRYVLFYEPGMDWTDYEATVRFESDAWFTPPSRSSAWVYFRYRGVHDCYAACWDAAGDLTICAREPATGVRERVMARVPVDSAIVRDGKPWVLKIKGDTFEIWHEGTRFLQCTDTDHPAGTLGLESVHIPMTFREFRAR